MDEVLEISIDSPAGTVDCRLEPETGEGTFFYNATILYPNVVDGFSRSEIYCHNMQQDKKNGDWHFIDDEIHPKIKGLESKISEAIKSLANKPKQK
jgi:hypothetical protein